jgi:hypothetical protein
MDSLLVTLPQIGRLLGRPRRWAVRQVDAGRFGPIVHRRGRCSQSEPLSTSQLVAKEVSG